MKDETTTQQTGYPDGHHVDIQVDMKRLFGLFIKQRRALLGITQEKLAHRADLHRTYVADVERGARNISFDSILKLAGALEISVGSLFGEAFREAEATTLATKAQNSIGEIRRL